MNPALHWHALMLELLAGEMELLKHTSQVVAFAVAEYVPALHVVHDLFEMFGLYVPGTHAVHMVYMLPAYPALHVSISMHGPPLGPSKPELQAQAHKKLHPSHEAPVFCGHAVHVPPFGP
jgi:hypothetical protein